MSRDLMFDIFAVDHASSTFSKVGAEAEGVGHRASKGSSLLTGAMLAASASAVAFGVHALKMSGDFEAALTRLTTTAGESTSNLHMVGNGLLEMAGKVGYSANELVDAMYEVESGGYHGAEGLKVLEAAAKGARVEGANVTDVAHALTGALNDYKGTNLTATEATNAMTAAVGAGMMRFQDLAEALPNIGTRAAGVHVSLEEVLGAIAAMTADGLPAAKAATYLGQTLGQLAGPTAKATKEMEGLGINATLLSQTLTSGSGHGLGDAVNMIYKALQTHLTPAGLEAVEVFKKGAGTTADWQKMLANVPPVLQTSFGALANMTGGVKSLQGVLAIGGAHAQMYADDVAAIREQVGKGGADIAGFAEAQQTLNGKLADAKGAISALTIQLGQELEPAAKVALAAFTSSMNFLQEHKQTVFDVGVGLAAMGAAYLAIKGYALAAAAAQAMMYGAETLAAVAGLITEIGGLRDAMILLDMAMDSNPIGVVVGTIGLIAGVAYGAWEALHHGNEAMSASEQFAKEYKKSVDDLSGSFDRLSGSITQATSKQIYDKLVNAKANPETHMTPLQAGGALGLDADTLVQAAEGVAAAQKKVNAAFDAAAAIKPRMDQSFQDYYVQVLHTKDATQTLSGVLGENSNFFRESFQKARDAAMGTHSYADALRDVKNGAAIASQGVLNNAQDVAKVAIQYQLTGQDIQRVLDAYWIKEPVAAVQQSMADMQNAVKAGTPAVVTAYTDVASNVGDMLAPGLGSQVQFAVQQAEGIAEATARAEFPRVAHAIAEGIGSGMSANQVLLASFGGNAIAAVVAGAQAKAQIQSPSKLFRDEVGKNIALGIGVGMDSMRGHLAERGAAAVTATKSGMGDVSTTLAGLRSKSNKKAELVDVIVTALQQSGLLNQRPPAVRTV